MVIASSHDDSSVMAITCASGAVYSPTALSASTIGRKAAMVVSDEISSGMRSSFADAIAAVRGSSPACIRTRIDSLMTMALSTRSPSAMMSDASDILSRPMPKYCMSIMVAMIAIGTSDATTSPVRSPRKRSMLASTIATA